MRVWYILQLFPRVPIAQEDISNELQACLPPHWLTKQNHPCKILRAVWKLTASKSHLLTKPLLYGLPWQVQLPVEQGWCLGSSLHITAPCAPLLPDIGTGKSCFYPAFCSSEAASWLYPLNMLPMDSSELTAHHQLPSQLACLAPSSACCSYVNTGHCLPSIVGKPVVGGGCQKKKEGWISNAKPNAISKTKLKMPPLNLPRQFHNKQDKATWNPEGIFFSPSPIPDGISQNLHSCLGAGDVNQTILLLTARNSNGRQVWHEKGKGSHCLSCRS